MSKDILLETKQDLNNFEYKGHGVSWKIGDKLTHKSGREYIITDFANTSVDETIKFPHCAVYENTVNGTNWTRPIKDMVSRFTLQTL